MQTHPHLIRLHPPPFCARLPHRLQQQQPALLTVDLLRSRKLLPSEFLGTRLRLQATYLRNCAVRVTSRPLVQLLETLLIVIHRRLLILRQV